MHGFTSMLGFFALVAYFVWLAFVENIPGFRPAYFVGAVVLSIGWVTLVRSSLKRFGQLDMTWLEAAGAACYTAVPAALVCLAVSTSWTGVQKAGWRILVDPSQRYLLWPVAVGICFVIAAEGFRQRLGVTYRRAFFLTAIAIMVGVPCAVIVFRLARRLIEGR